MKIHQLSQQLANQIAAGEVIERPASVVKELLENSLDAGAKRIQLDIERGGVQLIRVRDDAVGISKEDLPLALSRHATSKIRELSDLMSIASLGFRGEALASISSVSRLSLSSCAEGASEAWKVSAQGRDMDVQLEPTSHPTGTTVEVRDLFYNTPARRKFLRSDKTEFLHIEDLVHKIALSRFDTAFIFRHNQRMLLNLRPAVSEDEKQKRVATLCGKQFIEQALHVDFQTAGLHMTGWIGLPSYDRSQSDLQYFYINGRIVRDRVINHAVRQAYADSIAEGRYPCYVLYLDIDPQTVDVNVHPTKHEVRFRDSRLVHDFICSRVQQALKEGDEGFTGTVFDYTPTVEATNSAATNERQPWAMPTASRPSKVREQMASYGVLQQAEAGDTAVAAPPQTQRVKTDYKTYPLGSAVVQLQQRYLCSENQQDIIMTDVCQARQRIAYAKLLAAWQGVQLKSQPLLVPTTVTLDDETISLFERYQIEFKKLAMTFARTGPEALMLRQLPGCLKELAVKPALEKIANLLQTTNEKTSTNQLMQQVMLVLAQQAYIGKPDNLSIQEMNQLLRDLEQADKILGNNKDIGQASVHLTDGKMQKLFAG